MTREKIIWNEWKKFRDNCSEELKAINFKEWLLMKIIGSIWDLE